MAMRDLVPWRRSSGDLPARRDASRNHPFLALQQQMNHLFDDFFQGFGDMERWSGLGDLGQWNPSAHWDETDGEYTLTVELPGLSEKDLDVRLSGDTLTLQARKEESYDEKDKSRSGRSFRSFHQSLTLPPGIDREQIQANLRNGVLTLALPKTEEARKTHRSIEVKTG